MLSFQGTNQLECASPIRVKMGELVLIMEILTGACVWMASLAKIVRVVGTTSLSTKENSCFKHLGDITPVSSYIDLNMRMPIQLNQMLGLHAKAK